MKLCFEKCFKTPLSIMDALYRAFQNSELVDVTLVLQDERDELPIDVHKLVLFARNDFFRNLFTLGAERGQTKITLKVHNIYIAYDLILSLYDAPPKYKPEWEKSLYEIDRIVCMDYWQMPWSLDTLFNTHIPPIHFNRLLDLLNVVNVDDTSMTLILENLPQEYDLRVLSDEFRRELYRFATKHIKLVLCNPNKEGYSVVNYNSASSHSYSVSFTEETPEEVARKKMVKIPDSTSVFEQGIALSPSLGEVCFGLSTKLFVYSIKWGVHPVEHVKTLDFPAEIESLTFSPDSKFLGVKTSEHAMLYETQNYTHCFNIHKKGREISFSNDSSMVAFYALDVWIFSLSDFKALYKVHNPRQTLIREAIFGTRKLRWNCNGIWRVFDFDTKQSIEEPWEEWCGDTHTCISPDEKYTLIYELYNLKIVRRADNFTICNQDFETAFSTFFSADSSKLCVIHSHQILVYSFDPFQKIATIEKNRLTQRDTLSDFTVSSWFDTLPEHHRKVLLDS